MHPDVETQACSSRARRQLLDRDDASDQQQPERAVEHLRVETDDRYAAMNAELAPPVDLLATRRAASRTALATATFATFSTRCR